MDRSDHGWWVFAAAAGSPLGGFVLGFVFATETCTAGICQPQYNYGAAAYATFVGWGLTAVGAFYFWVSDSRRSAAALEAVVVPDVLGDDEARARARLEASQFRVLVHERATTNPAEDGLVIDQQPGVGRAQAGQVVILYVARLE